MSRAFGEMSRLMVKALGGAAASARAKPQEKAPITIAATNQQDVRFFITSSNRPDTIQKITSTSILYAIKDSKCQRAAAKNMAGRLLRGRPAAIHTVKQNIPLSPSSSATRQKPDSAGNQQRDRSRFRNHGKTRTRQADRGTRGGEARVRQKSSRTTVAGSCPGDERIGR